MALTFAGALDRDALARACRALVPLVSDARVAERWDDGSALPGLTVGGLTRHLVSQPECAVEFLRAPLPPDVPLLSLRAHYDRADWLDAPVEHPANTSICADFDAMAAGGQPHSVGILEQSLADLPGAIAAAGPVVHVPWQDCALALDDLLAVRLVEVVVHADDLATSVGAEPPAFDDDVLHPALAVLAMLAARRHGQAPLVRALARAERSSGAVSAFGG
ncbi:hypothetical protein GCM10023340_18370 [Nocardioides marinquilinus]|uniref:Mycothiol-dependent maleylpyruvate isomerase metal-binding domain-containing protein n=1 Tax=Nocardioides marinquilinus TaxID=1210400 RepID=A0ABP9PHV1_9ACTN